MTHYIRGTHPISEFRRKIPERVVFTFVMVILKGSVAISFGGNKDPAAYAEVVSMGGINSAVKKELISTLGSILQSKLSIPRTRFFLKVFDTTAGRPTKSKL
ncbi:Macrophage migration inhibitory factor [Trema orientale]|uniref:Macrophage migration inhibitory factor n=1 Tax=Trema orientale TaxID=63057 RepID=A0A2P5F977_TREOI|nr:Macrophage migration inhibitory factor [Trema orientale]